VYIRRLCLFWVFGVWWVIALWLVLGDYGIVYERAWNSLMVGPGIGVWCLVFGY